MTPKLTEPGKNLLLRALAGESITFTKIQIGNGNAQEPTEATGLANPILTIELSKVTVGSEYVTLTAQFTNGTVASGFHITEVGVFAIDPDDNTKEILYAIGDEDESTADYVPDASNRILEMQLDAIVFIGDAQNVTAAISSSLVYTTKEDFDSHAGDKNNPHSVTKEQIGLGNVPNLSPSDQCPTFTQPSILVNIESGEKASTMFGKIKLAIDKLLTHLKDHSNPHGCTAAQVGAAAKGHNHNTQDINDGTLSVLRGGTGLSSPPHGGLLKTNGDNAFMSIKGTGALYSTTAGYPVFGTLPVGMGGTGATSVSGLAAKLVENGGLAKTIVGSYVGTGNYGANAKNSLTFDAPPKLLVIMPSDNEWGGAYGGFIVLRGVTSSRAGGLMDYVSDDWGRLFYAWNDNTVTWYSAQSAATQQNIAHANYVYFAIL